MKFLPFEKYTYKSKLKAEEIIIRLRQVTQPPKVFDLGIFGNQNAKDYICEIYSDCFDLSRNVGRRNSRLNINGMIQSEVDGTIIHVKIRPGIFFGIFLIAAFIILTISCIAVTVKAINERELHFETFTPYGALLIGYGILMLHYKSETSVIKKDLPKILKGEVTECSGQ